MLDQVLDLSHSLFAKTAVGQQEVQTRALKHRPPLGMLGQITLQKGGVHPNTIARQTTQGPPDNFLPLEELSNFERSHLKEAFSVIQTLQGVLQQRYSGGRS